MKEINLYKVLGRSEKVPADVLIAKKLLGEILIDDRIYRLKDLAKSYGWTVGFLQQISCKLRKAGIIGVKRGSNGGIYRKAA